MSHGFGIDVKKENEKKTNANGKKKQQLMFRQEVQKQLLPKYSHYHYHIS